MEAQNNLVETPSPGWKWELLFTAPPSVDREWRTWLAAAQRAENEALLTYWARRSR